MPRVGVFICYCGSNIGGVLDVEKIVEAARSMPDVVFAGSNKYTCSEPGQAMICRGIEEYRLDRIVIGSCSPHMHEMTFRKMLKATAVNPYMLEIANLREQCSWVSANRGNATQKGIDLVRMAVAKVRGAVPLFPASIPVTKKALVIGGGIAGIQTALDIANAGHKVTLVEREPTIGGKMVMLDKTFPTLDCSACISTPKMVDVSQHPNIELLTSSEVENVDGYIGSFDVTIRKRATFIDKAQCKSCSDCTDVCPVLKSSEFNQGLNRRTAVYTSFPQAVPNKPVIDKQGVSPCTDTCPAHMNAHGYIAMAGQGRYEEALEIIRRTTPFAGVLGRVCFHPCQKQCSRHLIDESLSIAGIKRFIADRLPDSEIAPSEQIKSAKIAVIGSGPAGLNCAYMLAREGYRPTVFESSEEAGGMLRYGIPDYRLDKNVLSREIALIEKMGVTIKTGTAIGGEITLDDLRADGYRAFFVAIGAQKESPLGIENEDQPGMLAGIDFLRAVNSGGRPSIGKNVLVIGGGNVAMDAARSARRLGCSVTVVYRRTMNEMPANDTEIRAAEEEGVCFECLTSPLAGVVSDGHISGVLCIRNTLGEADESGRRKPEPIADSEFTLPADCVIKAVGQRVDGSGMKRAGLEGLGRHGEFVVDGNMATYKSDVFAGGDAVTGPATVIDAVAAGNRAAIAIINYLEGTQRDITPALPPRAELAEEVRKAAKRQRRTAMRMIPLEKRLSGFEEVELGFTEEQVRKEALRCVNCAGCCDCRACEKACKAGAVCHEQRDEVLKDRFAAIVIATGFQIYDWRRHYSEYGGGRYPDVISGIQLERLLSASGPTSGHILRPSDRSEPKDVVIVKCVGSRDAKKGHAYCSRACCMISAKHARQILEKIPGSRVWIFYMDVRTPGKDYEEFYERTRAGGAVYVRGRVSKIYEEDGKLICRGEDTLIGRPVTVSADMVVLETAMEAPEGVEKVSNMTGAALDQNHWFTEAHPKLRPVETQVGGVYLAGTCQGPKDIPDTVAQAGAAASKVIALLNQNQLETDPMISAVDAGKCSGCGICVSVCAYRAITLRETDAVQHGKRVKKMTASVNAGLCKGCGACTVACRTGCMDLLGFSNKQILEEVDALCQR